MIEDFSLPDPLPDMLPGEGRNEYRRRVIPGFAERERLRKRRDWFIEQRLEEVKHMRYARKDWAEENPDDAERLAYLEPRVRWVCWDDPVS